MNNFCETCESQLVAEGALKEFLLGYGDAKPWDEGRCDCCGKLGPVVHRKELNPPIEWRPKPELASPEQLMLLSVVDFQVGVDAVMSITERGVAIRGELTLEEFQRVVIGWERMGRIYKIGQSDLVSYGRIYYGDPLVDDLCDQLEFSFADHARIKAIAKIPWDARYDKLNHEHYYVVGCFEMKPELCRHWLAIADKDNLSPVELKRSIEAGKVVRTENTPSGKSSGTGSIVTIEEVRLSYDQWRRGNFERVLSDPQLIHRWLEEVAPFESDIKTARERLAQASEPTPEACLTP